MCLFPRALLQAWRTPPSRHLVCIVNFWVQVCTDGESLMSGSRLGNAVVLVRVLTGPQARGKSWFRIGGCFVSPGNSLLLTWLRCLSPTKAMRCSSIHLKTKNWMAAWSLPCWLPGLLLFDWFSRQRTPKLLVFGLVACWCKDSPTPPWPESSLWELLCAPRFAHQILDYSGKLPGFWLNGCSAVIAGPGWVLGSYFPPLKWYLLPSLTSANKLQCKDRVMSQENKL